MMQLDPEAVPFHNLLAGHRLVAEDGGKGRGRADGDVGREFASGGSPPDRRRRCGHADRAGSRFSPSTTGLLSAAGP